MLDIQGGQCDTSFIEVIMPFFDEEVMSTMYDSFSHSAAASLLARR